MKKSIRAWYVLIALLTINDPAGRHALAQSREQTKTPAATLVERLDITRFKQNIKTLSEIGSRFYSKPGNTIALDWLEGELRSYGYQVERQSYQFRNVTRANLFATKVGQTHPEKMYIISGHMDSVEISPGADDNGSGSAFVLETARVFAPKSVQTESSIRFIFWNNEETGLDGSKAYVKDRFPLQGIEEPMGSGEYPEPKWLGMIAADMILFDHGLPLEPMQRAHADINVEYQAHSQFSAESAGFARLFDAGCRSYARHYPIKISSNMRNTDSTSFMNYTPTISIRENTRDDIGLGSNPNHHQKTDTFATYNEDDFRLGFDVATTVTGTIAELAITSIASTPQ